MFPYSVITNLKSAVMFISKQRAPLLLLLKKIKKSLLKKKKKFKIETVFGLYEREFSRKDLYKYSFVEEG